MEDPPTKTETCATTAEPRVVDGERIRGRRHPRRRRRSPGRSATGVAETARRPSNLLRRLGALADAPLLHLQDNLGEAGLEFRELEVRVGPLARRPVCGKPPRRPVCGKPPGGPCAENPCFGTLI